MTRLLYISVCLRTRQDIYILQFHIHNTESGVSGHENWKQGTGIRGKESGEQGTGVRGNRGLETGDWNQGERNQGNRGLEQEKEISGTGDWSLGNQGKVGETED